MSSLSRLAAFKISRLIANVPPKRAFPCGIVDRQSGQSQPSRRRRRA
jgi:hypothetical protein